MTTRSMSTIRTIDSHIKRPRKKVKVVDDDFEMIEPVTAWDTPSRKT